MKQTMEKGAFKEMCRQTMESVQLIEQETLKDKLPEKLHCQAGRTSFAVSWQGKMQPCVMLNYPSFPIFEIGVKSSWQQLKNAVNEIYLSGECSVCKYRTVCQTCAACALHEGGSFDAVPKYMCRYTYMLADIQIASYGYFKTAPLPVETCLPSRSTKAWRIHEPQTI